MAKVTLRMLRNAVLEAETLIATTLLKKEKLSESDKVILKEIMMLKQTALDASHKRISAQKKNNLIKQYDLLVAQGFARRAAAEQIGTTIESIRKWRDA